MKVTEFAKKVTQKEGKKVQVNIAQILEILKILRKLFLPLGIDLYKLIKVM